MIEKEILKRILSNPQFLKEAGFNDQEIAAGVNPMTLATNDPRREALKAILQREVSRPEVAAMQAQIPGNSPTQQDIQGAVAQLPQPPADIPGMPTGPNLRPQIPIPQPQQQPQPQSASIASPALAGGEIPTSHAKTATEGGQARQTVFNSNITGSNIPGAGKLLTSDLYRPKTVSEYESKFDIGDKAGKGGAWSFIKEKAGNLWNAVTNPRPTDLFTPQPQPQTPVSQLTGSYTPPDTSKVVDKVQQYVGSPLSVNIDKPESTQTQSQPIQSYGPNPYTPPVSPVFTKPATPPSQPIKPITHPAPTTDSSKKPIQSYDFGTNTTPTTTTTTIPNTPVVPEPITTPEQPKVASIDNTPVQYKELSAFVTEAEKPLLKSYFDNYLGATEFAKASLQNEGIKAPYLVRDTMDDYYRKKFNLTKLEDDVLNQERVIDLLPKELEKKINEKDKVMASVEAEQDAIWNNLFQMQDNPDPANIGRRAFLRKKLATLSKIRGQQIQSYDRLYNSITNIAKADYKLAINKYTLASKKYETAFKNGFSDYQDYWDSTLETKKAAYTALEKAAEAKTAENKTKTDAAIKRLEFIIEIKKQGAVPLFDKITGEIIGMQMIDKDTKEDIGDPIIWSVGSSKNNDNNNNNGVYKNGSETLSEYAKIKSIIDANKKAGLPITAENAADSVTSFFDFDYGKQWFAKEYMKALDGKDSVMDKDGNIIDSKKTKGMKVIDKLISDGLSDRGEIKNILQKGPFFADEWDGSTEWYLDYSLAGGTNNPIQVQKTSDETTISMAEIPPENGYFSSPIGTGKVTGYGSSKSDKGLDLALAGDQLVKAPQGGVIISAKRENGWGNRMRVRFNDGTELRIGHLNSYNLQPGQRFTAGEVLARQGNTGNVMTADPSVPGGYRDVTPSERLAGKGSHVDLEIPGYSPEQVAQYLGVKRVTNLA